MNNFYYEEEETGHTCYQHSGDALIIDGFTVETFIEEAAMWQPYGAFIKGHGTRYGKSKELAIAAVIAFAKA